MKRSLFWATILTFSAASAWADPTTTIMAGPGFDANLIVSSNKAYNLLTFTSGAAFSIQGIVADGIGGFAGLSVGIPSGSVSVLANSTSVSTPITSLNSKFKAGIGYDAITHRDDSDIPDSTFFLGLGVASVIETMSDKSTGKGLIASIFYGGDLSLISKFVLTKNLGLAFDTDVSILPGALLYQLSGVDLLDNSPIAVGLTVVLALTFTP